jgi:DNA transformation protein and related proteins
MSKKVDDFHDYVMEDVFHGITGLTSKRMFGGYGLYYKNSIFAIITNQLELFFKVDEILKEKFNKFDSHPFVYKGYETKKAIEMAYWSLPEEIMEDKPELLEWIRASASLSKGKN